MKQKLTNRQKIDRAHETRMWIKDVIIPTATALVFIDRVNPGLKYHVSDWCKDKVDKVDKVKKRFDGKDAKFKEL